MKYGDITTVILIHGYGRKKDLLEAIQSIMKQEVRPKEIILVDNDSTDDSIGSVRKKFSNVKIIKVGYNSGIEGFNMVGRKAKTKYIMFADYDSTFPKTWIKEVLKKFEQEPGTTAAITTRFIEPGMPQWYLEHPDINTETYTYTFMGGGTTVRKDAFEKAEGYDKKLFLYVNERELTARWISRGYRVLYYPDVKTYHKKLFFINAISRIF